jgi:hypothetical protein
MNTCGHCQNSQHFSVRRVREIFANSPFKVTSRERVTNFQWMKDFGCDPLTPSADLKQDGLYFFLDCRYLGFEGVCPHGFQVAGDDAKPVIARRRGDEFFVGDCDISLQDPVLSKEKVWRDERRLAHFVRLDQFLSAYVALTKEFQAGCRDWLTTHLDSKWN